MSGTTIEIENIDITVSSEMMSGPRDVLLQYVREEVVRVLERQGVLSISGGDASTPVLADHGTDNVIDIRCSMKDDFGLAAREALVEESDSIPMTQGIESSLYHLGPGRSMSESERNYFEPRFNADFGNVRIHDDPDSHELAERWNARAFTVGKDIVFNKGEYSPGTYEGKKLEAHELTHVVQDQNNQYKNEYKINRYQLPELPEEISAYRKLIQLIESTVASRVLLRFFWRVIGRRFEVRITAAVATALADGPEPFIGDLIALGISIWTIVEIVNHWDEIWAEAEQLAAQEGIETDTNRGISTSTTQEESEESGGPNAMGFQVQWNPNANFSEAAHADPEPGVTTTQAVSTLRRVVGSVRPNSMKREAEKTLPRVISWINSRRPHGVYGELHHSTRIQSVPRELNARIDVANYRGHNLRI